MASSSMRHLPPAARAFSGITHLESSGRPVRVPDPAAIGPVPMISPVPSLMTTLPGDGAKQTAPFPKMPVSSVVQSAAGMGSSSLQALGVVVETLVPLLLVQAVAMRTRTIARELHARFLLTVPLLTPPATLSTLAEYAAGTASGKQEWPGGPEALIEIRNLLVHPQKKLRPHEVPHQALLDVSELSVLYLQLALMYVLGYSDRYIDRVVGWSEREVPWSVAREIPATPSPHFPPLPGLQR